MASTAPVSSSQAISSWHAIVCWNRQQTVFSRLSYGGEFDFGLSAQKEEYTRGFRETAGIISEEGVYLAGSGFWYPSFGDQLLVFEMEVDIPEDWHVISQGNGTSRDEEGQGPLVFRRRHGRDLCRGRAPPGLRGGRWRGQRAGLSAHRRRRPGSQVPDGDGSVHRDVPRI